MTIVLVIMALCLGAALPMFRSGTGPAGLRTLARSIAAELRLARSTAIGRAGAERFVVDIRRHRYGLDGQTGHAIPADVSLAVMTADTEIGPDGVADLAFFPDGSSIGGRITLEARAAKYTVAVDWLTGRVHVDGPLR